jgi:hypothetical protein
VAKTFPRTAGKCARITSQKERQIGNQTPNCG